MVAAAEVPVYHGPFGKREAERLLWRAGGGPQPGEAKDVANKGLKRAVDDLLHPPKARLIGGAPTADGGEPLAPRDAWGHDHLWWLDRMVRSNQQLVERMTLVWHDWFATSNAGVGSQKWMLNQNSLFRKHALGNFESLLIGVTRDPAMLIWLNGRDNTKWSPNENYARELMEIFTLGAGNGYTEEDVREQARALTGWRNDWVDGAGDVNFRYDANRHDNGVKVVFGKSGNFGWQDACRLCVQHPPHLTYFVRRLWSYFIPTPPSATTESALKRLYKRSGYDIAPVVGAILKHPSLYTGPAMLKPPVVQVAGMLRARRRRVDTGAWAWISEIDGQRLFYPPDVSGWDDSRWLDTSTVRGRFELVSRALADRVLEGDAVDEYDETETPEAAVAAARAWAGDPSLTPETVGLLTAYAANALAGAGGWQLSTYRGLRQNALRHLILASPDYQTS